MRAAETKGTVWGRTTARARGPWYLSRSESTATAAARPTSVEKVALAKASTSVFMKTRLSGTRASETRAAL